MDTDERAILISFRDGVRAVAARMIWKWAVDDLGHPRKASLARRIDLSAGNVSKGVRDGVLTVETLVFLLSQHDLEFSAIPDMPKKRFRAFGGILKAVSCCRKLELKDQLDLDSSSAATDNENTLTEISLKDFFCLWCMTSRIRSWTKLWTESEGTKQLTGSHTKAIKQLTRSIADDANSLYKEYVRAVPHDGYTTGDIAYIEPEHYDNLRQKWAISLEICRDVLTRREILTDGKFWSWVENK